MKAQLFYVCDSNTNQIDTITPSGTKSVFVSTGLSGPYGLVMDSSGNLYESDTGTNTIIKITPTGTESTFATGFNHSLVGLSFDANGNLYVSNNTAGNIIEVTPSGVESTFATVTDPWGSAFDSNGNFYVAVGHGVDEITPGGVVSTYAWSGSISGAAGIAFGLNGVLYLVDKNNGVVDSISTSGVISTFATGMTNISGITYDPVNGDFYTSGSAHVYQITSSGTVTNFAIGYNAPRDILYDPTPEPSTYALLIFGGAFLLFVAQHQKRKAVRAMY